MLCLPNKWKITITFLSSSWSRLVQVHSNSPSCSSLNVKSLLSLTKEMTLESLFTTHHHHPPINFSTPVNQSIMPEIHLECVSQGRFQIEKKICVTLLQPSSVYLPTPFIVTKGNFLIFFSQYVVNFSEEKIFLVKGFCPNNFAFG